MNQQRRTDEQAVLRGDPDGRVRTAPDWESLTERLIREAQEDGHFDDLPGQGLPLTLDGDTYAGDMASANRLLRNAGAAPPWIESDKYARALSEQLELVFARAQRSPRSAVRRLRQELESLADAHDAAVGELETVAPSARQHRRRLDREDLRARLDAAIEGTPGHR